MKTSIKNISCAIALFLSSGCVDLDRQLQIDFTEKQILESYDLTLNRLTGIYTSIPNGFYAIGESMAASASDEAEYTLGDAPVQQLNYGSWNSLDNPDNLWPSLFTGIRRANQLLASTDSINLDALIYDPTKVADLKNRLEEINRLKHEARFLRAYFYFELVKRYGGVPLLTEAMPIDADFKNIKRNTLKECIDYILAECNEAAKVLPAPNGIAGPPVVYGNADIGRVTKYAALALKSRVWLYAASDLFNTTLWAENAGGFDEELKNLISLPQDVPRQVRWDSAARAAKRLIDQPGMTALNASYPALFTGNSFTLAENIFTRRVNAESNFERLNYPIGYQGNSGTTPSQNLVDAYDLTTGAKFDWTIPAQAAAPYSGRDPRLGHSILVNGVSFNSRPIEAFTDGKDGKGKPKATKTGYYLRKYLSTNIDLGRTPIATSFRSWNIIRLAEIHLNYAEALNEASPGHGDIAIYYNKVRQRATVAMTAMPVGLSQSQVRERIINERRVEFAFEDHRRWDLRRWLLAETYLNAPLYGADITKASNGTITYSPFILENRVFTPRMYLLPIPQSEILLSPSIKQNPGW